MDLRPRVERFVCVDHFSFSLQVLPARWPRIVALPFAIILVANLSFTPIQFALRNNILALVDILIVLCTIRGWCE